ncbi:hypothetical protein [Companilactobacillus furfuricola]|uniref:hypothetical protein n=1 Tax=Companilactobacillus furfuricola TaxID=1462575 RepID=UPI000F7ACA08|nr:hypothetical protein [Companilactobacillus furfuricola]
MEYPKVWFGAVIDEHGSDIRDRIFEYAQIHGPQYGDLSEGPDQLEDYLLFMENYSLSGYDYIQEEGQALFEREDKFNETVRDIVIRALNIDVSKLSDDIYNDDISENLLDYVGSKRDE